MKLGKALQRNIQLNIKRKMIIDANIFLELFLKQSNSERCKVYLNKIINGELNAIVSDFTVDTIIIVMERNKVELNVINVFLQKLLNSKGLKIYSINMKDRIEALKYMKKYDLDYEDALILQSAISTKSERILSFDKHFDKIK